MKAVVGAIGTISLALVTQQTDFFSTTLSPEEMKSKQAVVQTTMGSFVIDFLPNVAPNHVGYFMKLSSEGAYDGTAFHRIIRYGIIQGGDPLTTDLEARDRYGTGGLGKLEAEFSEESHTRGAVSAVRIPGKPNSAGSQFFVCVTDQVALDGQFTVYGRVVEGMEIVEKISEVSVDDEQHATERVEIVTLTLRDKTAGEAEAPDTPPERR